MFAGAHLGSAHERVKSALAVVVIHVLLGYALLAGLGVHIVQHADDPLKLFDVLEPPPPLPPEPPHPVSSRAPEGANSPENLKARPAPIVAPPPRLEVPTPVVAAPIAGPAVDSRAGASDHPGPGTGAGGAGRGTGSGGNGNGTGAGAGTGARLIRGTIRHSDYPRSAYRERIGGTVIARLAVDPSGRVNACYVTRSSGNSDLDTTTCRLIEERFRFEPARDSQGRAIASVTGWQQRWWLERN